MMPWRGFIDHCLEEPYSSPTQDWPSPFSGRERRDYSSLFYLRRLCVTSHEGGCRTKRCPRFNRESGRFYHIFSFPPPGFFSAVVTRVEDNVQGTFSALTNGVAAVAEELMLLLYLVPYTCVPNKARDQLLRDSVFRVCPTRAIRVAIASGYLNILSTRMPELADRFDDPSSPPFFIVSWGGLL